MDKEMIKFEERKRRELIMASSNESHALTVKGLICNAGAGAAAGIIAATFVCPLDVIKTRFQVHGLPQLNHSKFQRNLIVGSLEHILRKEGVPGMYRGLAATVLALLPNWAIYFTVYEQLKGFLNSPDENHHLSLGANMIAASGAGVTTTLFTNPLWVVKTRLQAQGSKGDNTTVDKLGARDVAIASSISKIFASTLTYPHEVVRSRLMEQGLHSTQRYTGVIDCVRKMYKNEGIIGFYRGCGINLLRTTPAAVITFTSFEMIHRFLLTVLSPNSTR
ncbi:Nicotinamide adenine dinucleotide transporter 1, chloroplastic [Linum grandiflorum]